MKNLTIGILLIFLSSSAFAQPFHEIKLNSFAFLMNQVSMSYEYVVNKNFGVEVGLAYNYDKQNLVYSDNVTNPLFFSADRFKKKYWVARLHTKFYPSKRANGDRFNLGGFFHFRSKHKIESAYFEAYEEFYNMPTPASYSQNAEYVLGGFLGYKLLVLKKRFFVEPVYGIGTAMSKSDADELGFEITGLFQFNLGYRF